LIAKPPKAENEHHGHCQSESVDSAEFRLVFVYLCLSFNRGTSQKAKKKLARKKVRKTEKLEERTEKGRKARYNVVLYTALLP
jgi:hypothetical protein